MLQGDLELTFDRLSASARTELSNAERDAEQGRGGFTRVGYALGKLTTLNTIHDMLELVERDKRDKANG